MLLKASFATLTSSFVLTSSARPWDTHLSARSSFPDGESPLSRRADASNCTKRHSTVTTSPSNRLPITLEGDDISSFKLGDGFDCLSQCNPFNRQCWATLRMTDWLKKWREDIKACPSSNEPTWCLQGEEPWTEAFLRMFTDGDKVIDCFNIGSGCESIATKGYATGDPPLLRARYNYVLHAIVLIGKFFNSWHDAVESALQGATNLIEPMISVIAPPEKTHVLLSALMSLLAFGLQFIPAVPEGIDLIADLTTNEATNILTLVKSVPGIVKEIWPQGTRDSRSIQANELFKIVANPNDGAMIRMKERIGNTLKTVQGSNSTDGVAPFLAFAETGDFSAPLGHGPEFRPVSAEGQKVLLQAFTTFLASTALAHNDWKTLTIPGLNMNGIQTRTSPCPAWAGDKCNSGEIDWCGKYDDLGLCDGTYWWYSAEHDSMYTIVKDEKLEDDADGILRELLKEGWVTGPALFENAAVCEYLSLFPPEAHATYTARSDTTPAGIVYTNPNLNPVPDLDNYASPVNGTHRFIPINGNAFMELAKRDDYDKRFDRQGVGEAPFGVLPDGGEVAVEGMDLRCVSQMRTVVATAWKKRNWRHGSGKA